MTNTIVLSEPTVDYLISQGWVGLQLERGVSSTNLGSFEIVAQIPYASGQTSYSYVDADGASSDWYRVVRYMVGSVLGTYSPPWPVTPPVTTAGDGARRSFKNCRRMLARKVGSLRVFTTTADGNDAGTTLISRALANQIDANALRGWWIMPTDGVSRGEIRVIGESALNASSGQLTVGAPFISKIVQGTQIEGHRFLPPDDSVGPPIGLKQALNMALAECWMPDRLALTATGAVTQDIASLGDWLDPSAVYELYGPGSAGALPSAFGPYVVRGDAAAVALDVAGLAAGAALSVDLTRPGDTYMRVAGVWTSAQRGFEGDDDECVFQPEFITSIALPYCYEAMAATASGPNQVRYARLAEDARRSANVLKQGLYRPGGHSVGVGRGDDWTVMSGTADNKSYWS